MRNRILTCTLSVAAALVGCVFGENPVVEMTTNYGTLTIELDQEKAPISVANFLGYVEDRHYDGMIFHRVVKNFVIQGGGYAKSESSELPATEMPARDPIKNDSKTSGLSNLRGTIAVARTQKPDSGTSQFYINLSDKNSKFLDAGGVAGPDGWAVFGKVTGGMDVVDKIAAVPTHKAKLKSLKSAEPVELRDTPVKPVVIELARVISGGRFPPQLASQSDTIVAKPIETTEESQALENPTAEAGGAIKNMRFFDSGDGMIVELDFGETGTTAALLVEWSEDLRTWAPATEAQEFPKGTKGLKKLALPEGKSMMFLRLVAVGG